jgi:hypothetical protein
MAPSSLFGAVGTYRKTQTNWRWQVNGPWFQM